MLDRDLLKKFLLAMKMLTLISSGTATGIMAGLGVRKYLLGSAWVVVIGTVLGLGLGLWTSLQIYTKSEKL